MEASGDEETASKMETSLTGQKSVVFPIIKLISMARSSTKLSDSDNKVIEKKKTTDRERMKIYRQRIKSCQKLYEHYKDISNERNRAYRANLSVEQRLNQRQKTRLRVQIWRENKKLERKALENNEISSEFQNPKPKPKTRIQCQKLREQWRNSKQKQRANMSSQKRRRVNEKRRQKNAEKKASRRGMESRTDGTERTAKSCEVGSGTDTEIIIDGTSVDTDVSVHVEESRQAAVLNSDRIHVSSKSNQAQRKVAYSAKSEVKQSIPSSPETFAKFMTSLARTTPRKRKALEMEGILLVPRSKRKSIVDTADEGIQPIKKELYDNRRKRSRAHLRKRRLLANVVHLSSNKNCTGTMNKQIKSCGLSWKFFTKASTMEGVWEAKRRNDRLDEDTVDKIEEFLNHLLFQPVCQTRNW